jgi:hypothetical protein
MIPVFDGSANSDSKRFFKQFKGACMVNGDRDPVAWMELLPIHLDDEASWWYDAQRGDVKASLDLLTKGLLAEFQERCENTVLGSRSSGHASYRVRDGLLGRMG